VKVRLGRTPEGVEFGLWSTALQNPAPTLVVLSGTIEEALSARYLQAGSILAPKGYLSVSIDLPCHGNQARPDRPFGLQGWADRAAGGEDFIGEFNERLSTVLDHLITVGLTDVSRIASSGTSRGGFLAIQYAAQDKRVRCAVGYCPVTDLLGLDEFVTIKRSSSDAEKLQLASYISDLVEIPIFIVIGDRDTRADTDAAIGLARGLSGTAARLKLPGKVALHVLPEARGHATPEVGARLAAEWIHSTLAERPPSRM
jgi:dienelactone hydrolase